MAVFLKLAKSFLIAKLKRFTWATRLYRGLFPPVIDSYNYILELQRCRLSEMKVNKSEHTFAFLCPVYNADVFHLGRMVDSIIYQSYTNFVLYLIDDASSGSEHNSYLSKIESNNRIKVIYRKINGHISEASNTGLSVVEEDYVVLIDQDDVLQMHALKMVVHALQNHPGANILYSDEDKLDVNGHRVQPHFKPDWNPDLLYSHNYISHLGIYKTSLLKAIGGFRKGYEGSQDYDLLLRAVEHCKGEGIVHIPYVLYHWRALPGSTAFAESEKSYAETAGLKALQDRVKGLGATVEMGRLANTYKVCWPIPDDSPLVSIIIPTRNGHALVKQCIDSLYEKNDYKNFEILLVDNQSDEPAAIEFFSELEAERKIRWLHYDDAFNYSAINNFAVTHAQGEVLLLLNNDVEAIHSGWLREMVSHAIRPDIGCVGAKLFYPDGRLQHAGVITGLGGVAGHSHKYFPGDHPGYFKRLQIVQNLSAVTAACLAVRKCVFEQVGGLNEKDLTVAFNDVDFCLKVREAGYRNLWTPYAELIHHESVSRGPEDSPEKQARFQSEINYMKETWGDTLMNDPHYSRWLTLDREDFTYR
ncbi:glycosyltransferase [Photobacterium sp. TLY01]|uniref:glycosyltransferase family 2 protein n=1 Tax=Photobacterium sp. TLY01 TaxID=2907534 RepID=UPI001F291FA1|nr:glycosyltransferase family 2 protein [Photobacterium sp. TLY01]UIP27210.1 glycosyltransferase family 2 protein [Photobacterium sp. TLY01]